MSTRRWMPRVLFLALLLARPALALKVEITTDKAPVMVGTKAIATVSKGQTFVVYRTKGLWYGVNVTVGGEVKFGWIHSNYCEVKKKASVGTDSLEAQADKEYEKLTAQIDTLVKEGKKDEAVELLDTFVETYKGTPAAKKAFRRSVDIDKEFAGKPEYVDAAAEKEYKERRAQADKLVAEGKVNLDDMTSKYVPSLQGSLWDEIPVWATATMCPGLDVEETMVSIIAPGSWINNFHHTFLGEYDVPYTEQLRTVKRHPSGEKPGDPKSYRYSSANPLVLQFICEAVEKKPFGTLLQERVWEKGGFRNPMLLHLAPDGMGVGYGMMSTTPEDMLRYAMLYTPSWNKVASEKVVTEEMDRIYRSTARVQTYEGSTEEGYNLDWFGHSPKSQGIMWDCVFEDGAMFKHGNMGQGIYIDPKRDFCAMGFGTADNNAGIDYAPGYMRAAAKLLAGK